jgi:23S rRNA (cytidine2498-2'-O)-methyltransferase
LPGASVAGPGNADAESPRAGLDGTAKDTVTAHFIFVACQAGSESALKQEIAGLGPGWRFAFSRPGFVTFRTESPGTPLRSVFARTWGRSLGKAGGDSDRDRAGAFWACIAERLSGESRADVGHLHVWQRAPALPGDDDYSPESSARVASASAALLEQRPDGGRAPALNAEARRGERVLDCVLVEPREWWFGTHLAAAAESCWPGGVPNLAVPADMISRAYLKLAEALAWSGLPIAEGDRCVEIGSAPGGSCQLLLERGCVVTGIDPAEMDARLLAEPRFTHLRARAKDLKRNTFEAFRWLICDANVAPKYTLDTVGPIVTWPAARIEGLVLTLKLTDAKLVAALPAFAATVRSWGYSDVRIRQLAFNRQEVCLIATERRAR